MSVNIKQFANKVVNPADDGALYDFFAGSKSGIIYGCAVTNPSANNLHVADGIALLCGRMIKISAETIVASTPSTEQAGRIMIEVDLTNTDNPAHFVTQYGSLPTPTQEDLNGGGTIYQLPLATYRISTSGINTLVNINNQLKMGGFSFSKAGSITDNSGTYWSSDNANWSWATGNWDWSCEVCGNTITARVAMFCNIGQSGGGTSDDYDIIDMEQFFTDNIQSAIETELGESITPVLKHLDVVNVQVTSFTTYATRHTTVFAEDEWDAVTLGGHASNASDGHSEEAVFSMTLTF